MGEIKKKKFDGRGALIDHEGKKIWEGEWTKGIFFL